VPSVLRGEHHYALVEEALRELVENKNAPDVFVPYNYSSNAAEIQHVIASGPSYLFGFTATNANAAARFIQVFDTDKAVANGAIPNISVSAAATNNASALWIPPRRMDRGIVIAASTTQNTLTLAAADHLFDVQYV
jgi:hypothetical protein